MEILSVEEAKKRASAMLESKSDALGESIEFGEASRCPVEDKKIFFESSSGKSMSGIPFKIFEELLKDNRFKSYKYVWLITSKQEYNRVKKKYSKYKNLIFLQHRDRKFRKVLATAGFLISDTRLPYYFYRRDEQVYLYTGTQQDYDETLWENVNDNLNIRRMQIKNMLNTSFLLSSGKRMTQNFYIKNCKLDTLYQGKVIEVENVDLKLRNIIDCIFFKQLADVNIITLNHTDKKKILFIANYLTTEWWQRKLNRIFDKIDFSKYDVTVISKVVRAGKGLKVMESINSNVRVLMRSGYMGMTENEFESVFLLERAFENINDLEKVFEKVSKESINYEWQRIFGTSQFDQVILCDGIEKENHGLWHMFLKFSDVKEKILLVCEDIKAKKIAAKLDNISKIQFQNYMKRLDMFDKIAFHSEIDMNESMSILGKSMEQMAVLSDVKAIDFDERKELNTCVYQGKEYVILNEQGRDKLKNITICPLPKEKNNNYICNIGAFSSHIIVKLLSDFFEIRQQDHDAKLFLIDGMGTFDNKYKKIMEELNIENDVFIVSNLDINRAYLSLFDNYIPYSDDDIYSIEAEKIGLYVVQN